MKPQTFTEVIRQSDAPPTKGEPAAIRLLRHYRQRLRRCDALLTIAGVPEWVEVLENDGVPANDTASRLKWFLSRRKDVKPRECDSKLKAEMAQDRRDATNRNLQDMDQ